MNDDGSDRNTRSTPRAERKDDEHMSHPIPLTDPLSKAWLRWCMNEGIPTNTTARRLATLRSLPGAGTATREDVEAWWAARTGHAPASRANDLANLRSFYKWCRRWEHRAPGDDPTLRIDSPKVPRGLPRPMSRADLNHLLDVLPPDLRRAAALGAWAGLRVSEAATQDWADIDLELNRIRVLGKGAKTRQVGMSVLLLDTLLPNTGGNVVAGGGRPSSASVLQRRVNRAISAAGVEATFHQLRHRFGTIALANGANLLAVSRAMGHASVTTTSIYVATADAELDIIAAAVTR